MNQILKFFLAILFCCGFVQTNAQPRQDHALFFVVSDFNHWADFPSSSEQQVREIESELKTNYGFKTEFILNPTRRQVLDKLSSYQSKPFGESDQLLIYFSMHGEYKEGGTGALIPKDGKLKDNYGDTWIRHPLLADLVNDIPCDHVLLALDACYSGTFGGSRGKPGGAAFNREVDCDDKIKQALQHKSRQYATSGGAERTPTDSQFADKWLEALRLRNPDGVLNYAELFGVLHDAYPRPMYGEFKDHVKGGDFVFVNRSACNSEQMKTDTEDWLGLTGDFDMEKLFEHIRSYPNCIHKAEMAQYFGKTEDIEPSNSMMPIKDSSKPTTTKKAVPESDFFEEKGISMVRVEGGTFDMGCTSEQGNCADDEKPVHSVTVSSFSISRYEITNEQYARFLNEIGPEIENGKVIYKGNIIYDLKCQNCASPDRIQYQNGEFVAASDYEKHPVALVTWHGANVFAKHYGMRLPTEEEWEYAARGGKNGKVTKFSGSNKARDIAWYNKNSGDKTHPVGEKKANELGLFDMNGNVQEWCTGASLKGNDNSNPGSGDRMLNVSHITRGGGYLDKAQGNYSLIRVSSREEAYSNDLRFPWIGFRIAKD